MFAPVRPLRMLQCRALESLKLVSRKFQVVDSDVVEMEEAWKSVENLEPSRLAVYRGYDPVKSSSLVRIFAETFHPT